MISDDERAVTRLEREVERLRYESEVRRQALAEVSQERDQLKGDVDRARKDRWDTAEELTEKLERLGTQLSAQLEDATERSQYWSRAAERLRAELDAATEECTAAVARADDLEARFERVLEVLDPNGELRR